MGALKDHVLEFSPLLSGLAVTGVFWLFTWLAGARALDFNDGDADLQRLKTVSEFLPSVPREVGARLLWGAIQFAPPVTQTLLKQAWARQGLSRGSWVVDTLNVAAAVSVLLRTLAVCATLAEGHSGNRDAKARALKGQLEQLRVLLYSAAALLIVGVAEIGALMVLPVAPFEVAKLNPEYVEAVKVLAKSVTLGAGMWFTMLLGGIFLPAVLVLQGRVGALVVQLPASANDKQRKEYLAERGLAATPVQQLAGVLATLGPLLTGSALPALINLVGAAK